MKPPPVTSDDPPEVPLDDGSPHSNPAAAWATTKPAPSNRSVRSTTSAARALFKEAMEKGKEIRLKQFQERERELEQLAQGKLNRMKEESEAGSRATAPTVGGEAGDLEVLIRQKAEALAKAELLERIIQAKHRSAGPRPRPIVPPRPQPIEPTDPVQPSSPTSEYETLVISPSSPPVAVVARFTDISLKKVSAPKAWQGDFNYRRREAFVKSAIGYLASVGVALNKEISASWTPQAHLALRSLFSSESKGNFLSAVDWFDAIDREQTYITPQLIFAELRAHWVDDAAAEDAFRRYRQAKQGSLKVREYGALVEQLAFDCFDGVVSDKDRASTFREGLNSGAKDFILQVQAAQSAAFGTPVKMGFRKLVQVASAFDSVESRQSTSSSSPSSNKSTRSSANTGSSSSSHPSNPSPSLPSSSPSSQKSKSWVDNAHDWQSSHAVKDKDHPPESPHIPSFSSPPPVVPRAGTSVLALSVPVPDLSCVEPPGVAEPEIPATTPVRSEKTLASSGTPAKKTSRSAAKSLPPEPTVTPQPLTVPVRIGEQDATALVDSGSQADVLSSAFAHRLGLPFRRLLAPVHADLGADGHAVRLSVYAEVPVEVGELILPRRSLFVAPLPDGIDAILGVPWMRTTNTAVSATSLFVVPVGPSEEVFNFESGRFNVQPRRNFDDLGFVNRPMSPDEEHRFALCAVMADVEGIDDFVDFEPHNPLLDVDNNDPSVPDLSAEEAEDLLTSLKERFADVLVDALPDRLPPHCPIDHSIDLVNNELKIRPKVIGIPARYDRQWRAHVLKFKETGYWSPMALDSACSMFSVPKHDPSEARFVINLKPRNANTRKRISPIPDMKGVRSRLGVHRYRTKLDFKNAYEQICLALESVAKSGFVTPSGTFVSRVMQQGDTNAPDTMHRVCAMMFGKALGRFLDVFYDDVFIYSHTRRAHLRYLEIVLTTLRHYRFFLSRGKVELMAPSLKALGCIIDDAGVSVDPSQWDAVKNWPTPRNKKDIMRIRRLDLSPACQAAFELVKSLVPRTLSPLNLAALESGEEKLFIFSDASILGCGSWIGQGSSRDTARPFRYHSAKFNSAQRNYHTTNQELLGVLHACLKYRELILGWDVVVVTDHQPLRTYWDQTPKLTRRHVRLWETLSQFSLVWDFIPGRLNVFADALSRLAELCAEEDWLTLPIAQEPPPADDDVEPFPDEPSARMVLAVLALQSGTGRSSDVMVAPVVPVPSPGESSSTRLILPSLPSALAASLLAALEGDTLGRKVLSAPTQFPLFTLQEGLLFRTDGDVPQLYIPQGRLSSDDDAPSLVEVV
ncbi:hypothetical protein JCM11641_000055 [Rhodosporidiobolus odoratus]